MRTTIEPATPPAIPFLLAFPVATKPIVTARMAKAKLNRTPRRLQVLRFPEALQQSHGGNARRSPGPVVSRWDGRRQTRHRERGCAGATAEDLDGAAENDAIGAISPR